MLPSNGRKWNLKTSNCWIHRSILALLVNLVIAQCTNALAINTNFRQLIPHILNDETRLLLCVAPYFYVPTIIIQLPQWIICDVSPSCWGSDWFWNSQCKHARFCAILKTEESSIIFNLVPLINITFHGGTHGWDGIYTSPPANLYSPNRPIKYRPATTELHAEVQITAFFFRTTNRTQQFIPLNMG